MLSKTPKFDKALDEYYSKLELDEKGGQWRICRFSNEKFYVRPKDIEFYKRIRVPLPTLSPNERHRRRLATHNSYIFFRGTSAFSGKNIITIYPPGTPFKVYESKIWYSDAWNPTEYAKEHNPAVDFLKQLRELQLAVPRSDLISDPSNVNSDYTNASKNLKDCYVTFEQNGGEQLYYHQCCTNDRNCIDCWALDNSDTCYNCRIGENLFKCFACDRSENCIECHFLWDCRNCDHCFMSSNLRHKKYYFRNEYVGKEEYGRRMSDLRIGNYKVMQDILKEFEELKLNAIRKPDNNKNAINSIGDFIFDSRDAYLCFSTARAENVSYVLGSDGTRDSYDIFGGTNQERCYELFNVWAGDNSDCKSSMYLDSCREVEFSDTCSNCRNCFGCVGLHNKEFCILNKQYTETEYWKIVDGIKAAMLTNGNYGEFFPPSMLPFPYRVSYLATYPGYEDYDNAARYGYDMSFIPEPQSDAEGEVIRAGDLPENIEDVGEDILEKIVLDEKNNKKFRLVKQELDFYRKFNLPLPREHPNARMASFRRSFPIKMEFFTRVCPKCGIKFTSTYAPNRQEKNIYCEQCYLKEVV